MTTTLTRTYHRPHTLRLASVNKMDKIIETLLPRRCMVASTGLVLAGMAIPILMVVGLIPINLLLGFIGFALAATGGVLTLTLCGEI